MWDCLGSLILKIVDQQTTSDLITNPISSVRYFFRLRASIEIFHFPFICKIKQQRWIITSSSNGSRIAMSYRKDLKGENFIS